MWLSWHFYAPPDDVVDELGDDDDEEKDLDDHDDHHVVGYAGRGAPGLVAHVHHLLSSRLKEMRPVNQFPSYRAIFIAPKLIIWIHKLM